MSSKNPHIKKVKLKVLEIKETPSDEPNEVVVVELAKGSLAGVIGDTSIYIGEMTYQRPGRRNKKAIDFVEAVFADNEGATSEAGRIQLAINLTCDNKFDEVPVTTIPNDLNSVPTRCLSIAKGDNDSQIIITFEEPAEGQFVAYPALYFNTTAGIIDPGMGVNRKPIT